MLDPIFRIDIVVASQTLNSLVVHLRPRIGVLLLGEILLEGERRIRMVSKHERAELALG